MGIVKGWLTVTVGLVKGWLTVGLVKGWLTVGLLSKGGAQWSMSKGGSQWFMSKVGTQWVLSKVGSQWVLSKVGSQWVLSKVCSQCSYLAVRLNYKLIYKCYISIVFWFLCSILIGLQILTKLCFEDTCVFIPYNNTCSIVNRVSIPCNSCLWTIVFLFLIAHVPLTIGCNTL